MPVKTRSHFGLKHRGSVKSRRPEVPASRSPMKAMMTEVASSRGRTAWATSARSLVTAAVLVGQIAEGAATSLMMPLKISMHRDESNMMITMMVCSTIFAAGVLMGCLMQCVWRKLRRQAVVQVRREIGPRPWPDRPRLGREPLAMPSPPAPTMSSAPDTQPRRVFGLGRPRTDEDDNANRHGPDLDDEDGPPEFEPVYLTNTVSPEELAYLIQDAERVEARALAAMGGRVPLSQSLENARQRALVAIADRAARAAIADTMMPVAVTVPQAKARTRTTRTTAEGPRTTTLSCPLCGSTMTYKRARAGGGFFGCTTWPVCNGSRRPTADP